MVTKKPTGKIGFTRINCDEKRKISVDFKQIKFSEIKEEIEIKIVDKFVCEMEKSGAIFLDKPKLNKQDDFDFTLFLPRGDVYFELTEVVITEKKELPYSSFNTLRNYGSVADLYIARILEKDRKAKKRNKLKKVKIPVHLLCYVTHNDFLINSEIKVLIQQELRNYSHEFECVFYMSFIDENKSDLQVLYPSNNPLIEKELLQKLRDKLLINLNLE